MRKLNLTLIFSLLLSFVTKAQDIEEVDSILNISSEKFYNKEIRVYRLQSLTQNHILYRIYLNHESNWKIERYNLHEKIEDIIYLNDNSVLNDSLEYINYKTSEFSKYNITPTENFNHKWLELLATNILEIPSFSEYEYKLGKNVIGELNGKLQIFREITVSSNDGEFYFFKIINDKQNNEFYIHEPKYYIKQFPEVDELNYLSKFMTLLENIYK